ncbi:MAG: YggS family pyridoxal phosphate-dependent enzyme [Xenococcaceae cyanobacterium MO_167.B27]|nr:YggS family pyridoxal phosphate-dependent enzyme [Xenococcaceae cyanobacterium MO_167.B27]
MENGFINSIPQQIDLISAKIPDNVRLIAVSKQVSLSAIRTAYDCGIRDFAENRLQEAIAKQEQLQDLSDICWHFIGHIQTNKARKVLEHFSWIHSLDSLRLAQRLNKLAAELSVSPQVCLQVKILPDPNKYGWEVPELLRQLPQLNQCQHLKIQGLMAILPLGLSPEQALSAFTQTRKLAETIEHQQQWSNLAMKELSMGMSGDYLLAIEAGATMVRLGTLIFGKRK